MLKLTDGDKTYIKLTEGGDKPSSAFRIAYPEHEAVKYYLITEPGTPQRQKASEVLADAAKTKLQAKYIRNALMTYQDKMEEFSELSLEAATDLVQNARSEKVRADLAIEGIRHKIGTPVQKMQVQEKKVVVITFGEPPRENHASAMEGEVVEVDDQDGIVGMTDNDMEPTSPASYPLPEELTP